MNINSDENISANARETERERKNLADNVEGISDINIETRMSNNIINNEDKTCANKMENECEGKIRRDLISSNLEEITNTDIVNSEEDTCVNKMENKFEGKKLDDNLEEITNTNINSEEDTCVKKMENECEGKKFDDNLEEITNTNIVNSEEDTCVNKMENECEGKKLANNLEDATYTEIKVSMSNDIVNTKQNISVNQIETKREGKKITDNLEGISDLINIEARMINNEEDVCANKMKNECEGEKVDDDLEDISDTNIEIKMSYNIINNEEDTCVNKMQYKCECKKLADDLEAISDDDNIEIRKNNIVNSEKDACVNKMEKELDRKKLVDDLEDTNVQIKMSNKIIKSEDDTRVNKNDNECETKKLRNDLEDISDVEDVSDIEDISSGDDISMEADTIGKKTKRIASISNANNIRESSSRNVTSSAKNESDANHSTSKINIGDTAENKLGSEKEKKKSDTENIAKDANNGKSEVCKYYKRGDCTWGSRCRFVHPPDKDNIDIRKQGEAISAKKMKSESQCENQIEKNQITDGGKPKKADLNQICKHFYLGKCKWGDCCRFVHPNNSEIDNDKEGVERNDISDSSYRPYGRAINVQAPHPGHSSYPYSYYPPFWPTNALYQVEDSTNTAMGYPTRTAWQQEPPFAQPEDSYMSLPMASHMAQSPFAPPTMAQTHANTYEKFLARMEKILGSDIDIPLSPEYDSKIVKSDRELIKKAKKIDSPIEAMSSWEEYEDVIRRNMMKLDSSESISRSQVKNMKNRGSQSSPFHKKDIKSKSPNISTSAPWRKSNENISDENPFALPREKRKNISPEKDLSKKRSNISPKRSRRNRSRSTSPSKSHDKSDRRKSYNYYSSSLSSDRNRSHGYHTNK